MSLKGRSSLLESATDWRNECASLLLRDRAEVARQPHKLKVGGFESPSRYHFFKGKIMAKNADRINFKITPKDRELIESYVNRNDLNISSAIRRAMRLVDEIDKRGGKVFVGESRDTATEIVII